MVDLIRHYGRALERELAFDRRLARRAREEAEAHLEEMVAHVRDPQQAIVRFGAYKQIAKCYACALLPMRARRSLRALMALALLTFVLMRVRLGMVDPIASNELPFVVLVDRLGFSAGVTCCVAGWVSYNRQQLLTLCHWLAGAGTVFAISMLANLLRVAGPALADATSVVGILLSVLAELVALAIFWSNAAALRHLIRAAD